VLGAEIKEIAKRLEIDMLDPLQTIAAAFKESEEKRKKGVLLLTEGLGAMIDKHDELVQRVKALEEKCQESREYCSVSQCPVNSAEYNSD
jgi:hypothetical protein